VKQYSPELESKRIFLVASTQPKFQELTRLLVESRFFGGTHYIASDGAEALFKATNVVPHVAVIDADLPRIDGFEVAQKLLESDDTADISIILVSGIPDDERFVNEVVTGQVQFLTDTSNDEDLVRMISRGLNRISERDQSTAYRLRFLAPKETLFREGERAESVYFVKRGSLEVMREEDGAMQWLGTAKAGEFVGEMAHFNAEPRSATVVAEEACELVEIPCDLFDRVLFTKPAWAKALVETLSRRLKQSNQRRAVEGSR
jgi:CheY-like chemotaxis protein